MEKDLKAKYVELETRKWNNDAKMVKYLEKEFLSAVEVAGGMIVFQKPRIEKHYCYSYDEFQYDTVQIAQDKCNAIRNDFNAFLNANLRDINRRIDAFIRKVDEGNTGYDKVWIIDNYCNNDEYTKYLKGWTIENEDDIKFRFEEGTYRVAELGEVKAILNAYKAMKEYMIKKCKTYWKRYGGTKLRTWTYSMWD